MCLLDFVKKNIFQKALTQISVFFTFIGAPVNSAPPRGHPGAKIWFFGHNTIFLKSF